MSAFTLAALASEITNDPVALGYASHVSAHDRPGIAAILNATRAGVGTVFRNDVASADLFAAIIWSEVSGFTAAQVAWVDAMLRPASLDGTNANIRAIFAGLFAGKTQTLANLTTAAQKANPTRAEELWGYGTVITDNQIAAAGIN